MDANPNYEALKLISIIGGSVIVILLMVVGYFIAQQILFAKTLAITVAEIKEIVGVIKVQQELTDKFSNHRHEVIDNRLKDHGGRLDEHGECIVRIETKLKIS